MYFDSFLLLPFPHVRQSSPPPRFLLHMTDPQLSLHLQNKRSSTFQMMHCAYWYHFSKYVDLIDTVSEQFFCVICLLLAVLCYEGEYATVDKSFNWLISVMDFVASLRNKGKKIEG